MQTGQKLTKKLSSVVQSKYSQASENYWLRGSIQFIPYVGGTLDTWFFQFAENEKQKRIEESIDILSRRLDALGSQVDIEYIEKHIEEYAYLFEKFIRYTSQEYRNNLRKSFANLMANISTKTYSQQQNKDVYLSKLSELTPEHLSMLKVIYDYSYLDGKQDFEKTKTVKEHVIQEFKKNNLNEAIIYATLNDLQSKGLLNETYHPTFGGGLYTYHVTALGIEILNLVN